MPTQPPPVQEKPAPETRVAFQFNHSLEACAEALETLADLDARLEAQVALLSRNGGWDVLLVWEEEHNLHPNYLKLRFVGQLQRIATGSTLLVGEFFLDPATLMTRSAYAAVISLPVIILVIALWRYPIISAMLTAGWCGLLALMLVVPFELLRRRAIELKQLIEWALQ